MRAPSQHIKDSQGKYIKMIWRLMHGMLISFWNLKTKQKQKKNQMGLISHHDKREMSTSKTIRCTNKCNEIQGSGDIIIIHIIDLCLSLFKVQTLHSWDAAKTKSHTVATWGETAVTCNQTWTRAIQSMYILNLQRLRLLSPRTAGLKADVRVSVWPRLTFARQGSRHLYWLWGWPPRLTAHQCVRSHKGAGPPVIASQICLGLQSISPPRSASPLPPHDSSFSSSLHTR